MLLFLRTPFVDTSYSKIYNVSVMTPLEQKYKRKHFFINPRLQTHYMIYISLTLLICTGVAVLSMYFGIWGSVLKEFSSTKVQTDLVNAARMQEYEQARHPNMNPATGNLAIFREVELLTEHQKQIWSDILTTTHHRLMIKYLILVALIAWASIFLTHKIAGPLYRFQQSCKEITAGNLMLRVHLRKLDEAKEIAKTFNEMADRLDHSVGRMKQILHEEKDHEIMKSKMGEVLSHYKTTKP